jgi:translation initiation factor 6 (eIF-6)
MSEKVDESTGCSTSNEEAGVLMSWNVTETEFQTKEVQKRTVWILDLYLIAAGNITMAQVMLLIYKTNYF